MVWQCSPVSAFSRVCGMVLFLSCSTAVTGWLCRMLPFCEIIHVWQMNKPWDGDTPGPGHQGLRFSPSMSNSNLMRKRYCRHSGKTRGPLREDAIMRYTWLLVRSLEFILRRIEVTGQSTNPPIGVTNEYKGPPLSTPSDQEPLQKPVLSRKNLRRNWRITGSSM